MNKLWIITKKELQKTVLNRAFIIITIIGPFLIAGMFFLQYLSTKSYDPKTTIKKERTIKVIGLEEELTEIFSTRLSTLNINLIHSEQDKETLNEEALDKEITGYLQFPDIKTKEDILKNFKYYFRTAEEDLFISGMIDKVIEDIVITQRLKQEGLDEALIKELFKKPILKTTKITKKDETIEQNITSIIVTLIGFIMIIYMTIIFYGQVIGKSVNSEKTSKTVEIMLSSVKPIELMFGKIIGLGVAGLLQYGVWTGLALFMINVILPIFGVETASFSVSGYHFIYLIIFFILAFFLYSAGFASIGAAASDTHNMGQLSFPLIFPLVLVMFFLNLIIMQPNSPLVVFFSYFPFTSPIVMLGRILIDTPPIWEILISIGLLILMILIMTFLASKIFRVGILMSGKKVTISEMLKWLSYK
jgi:ABC-2 type transport system permease protein